MKFNETIFLDTFPEYQVEKTNMSGGGLKTANMCLAPLLVASAAVLLIIFLIKNLIQNSKNSTNVSASGSNSGNRSGLRTISFGLSKDATHQCRYNC